MAIVPAPPILVPEVAAGASVELDGLREAIAKAWAEVVRAEPDLVVCVGTGVRSTTYPRNAQGSFASFGVEYVVGWGEPTAETAALPVSLGALPGSLSVLAWLLTERGWKGAVEGVSVVADLPTETAADLGREIAQRGDRVALLVAGDGSAGLTERSPGYLVPGAVEWQSRASAALVTADLDTLRSLTPTDSERFLAAGRAPWQVAAGAAMASGGAWDARGWAEDAPYGVAYVVCSWTRADR